MLVYIKCDNYSNSLFDETEKNSMKLRNEECSYYNISIKLVSGDYFEKLIFIISCKFCQNKKKFEFTTKELSFNYSCHICNTPQLSINFVISEEEKKEKENNNNNILDEKIYTNDGLIIENEKSEYSKINNILEEKKFKNDEQKIEKEKNNEENITINIVYGETKKTLIFNSNDSFYNQYNKIFKSFGINSKKDIIYNSTKIDIYKSPKECKLFNNCTIQIID